MSMIGDASTYEGFATARDLKIKGNEKTIHVVGQLKKSISCTVEGVEINQDKTLFIL